MQQRTQQVRRPAARRARDVARDRTLADRDRRAQQAWEAQRRRAEDRRRATATTGQQGTAQEPTGQEAAPGLPPGGERATVRRPGWIPMLAILAVLTVAVATWAVLRAPGGDPPSSQPAAVAAAEAPPTGTTGTPDQGSYVRADVGSDGAVRTGQLLAAGDQPIRELRLSLPVQPGGAGDLAPRMSELQISADGIPVPGAPAGLATGETARVLLPGGADLVQLNFRTVDGVERASGSVPGRALVLVNALDVRTVTDDTVDGSPEGVVAVSAQGVLALACATPGEIPLLPCGESDGTSWTVDTPPGPTVPVIAQVDLNAV